MKKTNLNGVVLLDSENDLKGLDKKIQSRLSGSSLCREESYKLIGFAKVAASKANDGRDISEWVGVLCVGKNGKEIVIGLNTALGTSITGRQAPYTIHNTVARKFNSISELKNYFGKVVKVESFETLLAQVWEKDATRPKDFPIFVDDSSTRIEYAMGADIPAEAKTPKVAKTEKVTKTEKVD